METADGATALIDWNNSNPRKRNKIILSTEKQEQVERESDKKEEEIKHLDGESNNVQFVFSQLEQAVLLIFTRRLTQGCLFKLGFLDRKQVSQPRGQRCP